MYWARTYIPCQSSTYFKSIQGVLNADRHMVFLGWTRQSKSAVRCIVDYTTGTLLKHDWFGPGNVCSISETDPYIPNLMITGHNNDFALRIWTVDTCECLYVLWGHTVSPWGFAFVDDADDRDLVTREWRSPCTVSLLSCADRDEQDNDDQQAGEPPTGSTQAIVWQLDAFAHSWVKGEINPIDPQTHTDGSQLTNVKVAQFEIPHFESNEYTTSFYVLHPMLYMLSNYGTLSVYLLES
eukprot:jgi/Hompol1/3134/HPOL_006391-RA